MNKKITRVVDTLSCIAKDISNPVRCYRLAAGVIYKNQLVGVGVNSYKTHPFQTKYAKNPHAVHLHAEVAAIKNSLSRIDIDDLKKSTLVVVRVKRKDTKDKEWIEAMAKPCNGCMRAIAEFDVKNVVYTTEEGLKVL